jgi:hypothetical protein
LRTLLVTVAAAALLAACGPSQPKQETASTAPAAPAAENAQGPGDGAALGGPGGGFQPQTLDEMVERAVARFGRADADGDGKLTQAEIQAARPQRPPGAPDGQGRRGPPPGAGDGGPDGQGPGAGRRGRGGFGGGFGGGFARADANGDGIVTRDEVEAQTRERFQRLDADGDGEVTRDEMRAQFGRGPGGGAGDGPPA